MTEKLLVVEDDPGLQSQLKWAFDRYEVIVAADRNSALADLRRHEPAVVTLDLGLPPDAANAAEGLKVLEEVMRLAPHTKVVVVTGNEDRDNAVKAIAMGAYDFYQKPVDAEILSLIVERAFHVHALEEENRRLAAAGGQSPLEGIVATSPQMLKLCRVVEKVSPAEVTALILGESGTGKELIARAIHGLSNRADGPFVAINCAAIPENLLESELFGYEKGAFTGAVKQTKGKVEYANGGTLFLDEVGDLPMSLQAKLLRFLQERIIERVGGRAEIPVDVRVVCATHQNLDQLIQEDRFREDLYYRISEITLNIPPLRERQGDTIVLANAFLRRFSKQNGQNIKGFDAQASAALQAHDWPGNVRELENRVKRSVIMAESSMIGAEDLELGTEDLEPMPLNLREVRERAERDALTRALAIEDGNLSRTAELLGITRPTLYTLLDKFNMRT